MSDMKPYKDPSEYGNEKGLSIVHYFVKMIHNFLTAVDDNTIHEAEIVIAQLIDWQGAFDRQCQRLGVEAFIENWAKKSLIPILLNNVQNRQMVVKWKYKFIDDLSILEAINLVLVGLANYNFKTHVASELKVILKQSPKGQKRGKCVWTKNKNPLI